MKGLQNLIILGLILILFPAFLLGIQNSRTTSYDQIAPNIVTGAGVTTCNVTLVKPLFGDDLAHVTAIVSSLSDSLENPAVYTYTAGTKRLVVQGIAESQTRTLTITYKYGSLDSTSDTFMSNMPIFLIAGGLFLAAIGVWASYQSRR